MSTDSDDRLNKDITKAIMNTVTSQDVAIVAQRLTGDPTIQVVNYNLSPYSNNKLGYLGSHRQLKITIKHPTSLNEVYKNAFKEKMFNKQSKFYPWVTSGIDVVRAITTKLKLNTDKLTRIYDYVNDIIKPSLIHRNVINHGDLWWNNIMFDDSKPLPKCRLVDFQLMRYGPLVLDILTLLYVHTSRDYRNAHENELIEFYHSILTESIKSSDELAAIQSLEDVRFAYEDLRIFGPALASLYLPTHLIETEILNERVKDSEGIKEHIFGDRIKVTLAGMEQNEIFKTRMVEAVTELIELGERL